jgi:hypothetical protein
MNSTSYIYLIQDGGYINTSIYKVGRTTQCGGTRSLNRLKWYDTNTIQIYVREVDTNQVVDIEKDIIQVFRIKYNLVKGFEWFNGNKRQMILDINTIIEKYPDIKTKYISNGDNDSNSISKNIDIVENNEKILPDTKTYLDDTFCERCGIEFKYKKYLIQHLKKEVECLPLFSEIGRKDILTKIKIKIGVKCDKCNRIYKNKETLRKHKCTKTNRIISIKTIDIV